ncbi:MAG TPA: TIGR03032 family protein, partial [Thermoanaerobaculia bacterium]|nr:TIGR03032 family protein [Thermoanaerobaculia bacterium]
MANAERADLPRSVSSSAMASILEGLGISLIVSTYQTGNIVLISAENENINTHFVPFARPMGIALHGNLLAIGGARGVTWFQSQPDFELDASETIYDACFLPRRLDVTGRIAIHEIAFAGDELWIANTAFSALCTLDGLHSFVPRWRPRFISSLAAEDRCHLNGIAIDDERVRTVTTLSDTNGPAGWRQCKPNSGLAIDVPTGEVMIRGLSMPHSPRWYDGALWLLESGKGSLSRGDIAGGRADIIAELPGFTRGLAFAGPFAFIGLSQARERVFGGIELLSRVPQCCCGIWVIDIRSGETVAFIQF